LSASAVAFLLGFAAANYGVFGVARPDLWLWVAVAAVLMLTGVVGVLTADSPRRFSIWSVLGVELFAVFSLVPLLWLFSVATAPAGAPRTTLWPGEISWWAFGAARSGTVLDAIGTSALVAGLATIAAVVLAVPAAIGLVRRPLAGRRVAYGAVVAALVLPILVLAAPAGAQLLAWDLTASRPAMAVPTLAVSLPLAIWLCVRLVARAPWTLHAAMLADGADRRQRLRRFALPYLALDLLVVTVMVFYWTAGDLALGLAMAATDETRDLPATLLVLTGRGDVSSQVVAAAGVWWLLPAVVLLIVFSRRVVALLGRP
jgi:ABC-type glycerol-3-phosphate transport system permease component